MPGVRSPDLLKSALARPQTTAVYVADADVVIAGSMCAIAIARNPPFIDGNKRVARAAMRTFLQLDGVTFAFERAEAVSAMLALAAGEQANEPFIDGVRRHSAR